MDLNLGREQRMNPVGYQLLPFSRYRLRENLRDSIGPRASHHSLWGGLGMQSVGFEQLNRLVRVALGHHRNRLVMRQYD